MDPETILKGGQQQIAGKWRLLFLIMIGIGITAVLFNAVVIPLFPWPMSLRYEQISGKEVPESSLISRRITYELHGNNAVGSECCSNPPKLSPTSGDGHVEQIAGMNTYVSGNPHSKSAVLLASDVHGYEAPKLRNLADKIASAGYLVVVPDFVHGDPLAPGESVHDWIIDHAPEKEAINARAIIQALKDKKGIQKVAAGGFCWGAKVVVELAKGTDQIQAAALLHPSYVHLDDIKGVKAPIAILGAEFDSLTPPEVVKQYEAALVANKIDHFVKIYIGASHGWTIRYKDDDEAEIKRAQEAHQDLLNWFAKFV